jgi:hypothetical protein
MLNLPIYLYENKLTVILDLDATIRGVNQVMYQRDLKIQKGVKNQIQIQFKNSDQKRIPIAITQVFVFSMFDALNQRLLIEKQLEIIDDGTVLTKGLALLTLTESDTIDLEKSSYQYSVRARDADGTYTSAYTNTYYGVAGTMQLLDDVYPVLKPSQEIISLEKTFNAAAYHYEFKSGNIYSHPEFNSNSALHTMAVYMTNYRGTVYIQGTLNNTPASFGRYVTIAVREYKKFTGVDYFNFNGVFSFVRLMHVPSKGPTDTDNTNLSYTGTVDKALYRS